MSYLLIKYRNLPDPMSSRMSSISFFHYHAMLVKESREGDLDPYPVKVAGRYNRHGRISV